MKANGNGQREPGHRIAAFDVVRATVLIGVFVMNYIVEWNIEELRLHRWDDIDAPSVLRSVMNPWTGPLSTRFAATLSTLVGVGIVLLSARSVGSGDRSAIQTDRWRLRRRGMAFILAGIFFDVVWPGEILHFTGLYLIIAAWAITWSAEALGLAAIAVAAVTALQRAAVFSMVGPDERFSWWGGASVERARSLGTPRGFLSNVVSWGGHPVLPWMSFVFIGMAVAKLDLRSTRVKSWLLVAGAVAVAAGYGMDRVGEAVLPDRWRWAASTAPGGFGRVSPFGGGMPAYVLATAGSSVFFLVAVSWLADRFHGALPVRILAGAGKVTFSIYVAHGVIPWLLISRGWVGQNFGLVRSMGIAVASWAVAVTLGALVQRTFGTGPLEWLLRQISGPAVQPSGVSAGRRAAGTPDDVR